MKYRLKLSDGTSYTLSGGEVDIEQITQVMNSPKKVFVNFSGILVSNELFDGLLPILNECDESSTE